jgi:hypothetical protein
MNKLSTIPGQLKIKHNKQTHRSVYGLGLCLQYVTESCGIIVN